MLYVSSYRLLMAHVFARCLQKCLRDGEDAGVDVQQSQNKTKNNREKKECGIQRNSNCGRFTECIWLRILQIVLFHFWRA
jgi:hypothetical protein